MSIALWQHCGFQQDNAPWHKAQIISNWFLEHDTRSQSNRVLLGCCETRDSPRGCAANQSAASVWCFGLKSLKIVSSNLLNLCHKELRKFWKKNQDQEGVHNKVTCECMRHWIQKIKMTPSPKTVFYFRLEFSWNWDLIRNHQLTTSSKLQTLIYNSHR